MSRLRLIVCALLCILVVPFSAIAGDFDGSKPLLFVAIDVIECVPNGECNKVTPESIALPQFLKIDFKKKKILPVGEGQGKKSTTIENMELIDGKLIIQGAEDGVEGVRDGVGWTMAIAEETGKAVLTGSGEQVGFVVFGACTPI
ncbi:MAG: hypothetical protein LJE88_12970 [Deltaproteobacteria bacterium]|nr:hypothetical protein [Deltaproteobacteria bacterium]